MNKLIYVAFILLITSIVVPSIISVAEKKNSDTEFDIHEVLAQQNFYVTVEAGFSDDLQAKKTIEFTEGINPFTFSAGDRLYVRAVIKGSSPEKILAGFLNISDMTEKNATKAKFSGGLTPYIWDNTQNKYVSTKHDFNNVDDPLSECEGIFAMFVDRTADNFKVCDEDRRGSFSVCLAADVNSLVIKCLEVFGWYDNSTKYVALTSDNPGTCAPIFNYSISGGLRPNASYNVFYVSSLTDDKSIPTYSIGTVTADAEGKVGFACYNYCASDNHIHEIRFVNKKDNSDVKHITLGMKTVASRVYNITSTVTTESRAMAMANIAQ